MMVLIGWVGATALLAQERKINVVAAENFYGDIARQIGGDQVRVTDVMNNPAQDPHLFETAPGLVMQVADAQIVIYNGIDYDPWMDKLLSASPNSGRTAIIVADLVHRKTGDNPHIWYDPATMPAAAKAIAKAFAGVDPAHSADYAARLVKTLNSLDSIAARAAQLRAKYLGTPVTATEPVFGYMADALGLKMRNGAFQLAMMNDTEPSMRDVAAFEEDLKQHKVKVLFYNKQVSEKVVERMVSLAKSASIPVVGVTETQPPNVSFQDWMLSELSATEQALSR
jgi:zinc/manganese transport system substrate-binding protein